MFPLEISYRDFPSSDSVSNRIHQEAEKLDNHFERIMNCHVVVSAPHQSRRQGQVFHVNIIINIPGLDTIAVTNEPEKNKGHEDIFVAIRDAFRAMEHELEHRLKKFQDRRHESFWEGRKRQLQGRVEKIFPGEGYGFIKGEDGVDYYFHENSILNTDFYDLEVGDTARFAHEMGEKGPQISSMTLLR